MVTPSALLQLLQLGHLLLAAQLDWLGKRAMALLITIEKSFLAVMVCIAPCHSPPLAVHETKQEQCHQGAFVVQGGSWQLGGACKQDAAVTCSKWVVNITRAMCILDKAAALPAGVLCCAAQHLLPALCTALPDLHGQGDVCAAVVLRVNVLVRRTSDLVACLLCLKPSLVPGPPGQQSYGSALAPAAGGPVHAVHQERCPSHLLQLPRPAAGAGSRQNDWHVQHR
jgi:hypothetical protein